jgi:hypothetical protein
MILLLANFMVFSAVEMMKGLFEIENLFSDFCIGSFLMLNLALQLGLNLLVAVKGFMYLC